MTATLCATGAAMPEKSSPVRTSGVGSLLAGGVAVRALAAARALVFVPLLGPEAFGAFRLAQAVVNILAGVGSLGLHTCYARFLPELSDAGRTVLSRRLLGISMAVALLLGAALAIFAGPLSTIIFSAPGMMLTTVLAAVAVPAMVFHRSVAGMAQGWGAFGLYAVGDTLQSLVLVLAGGVLLIAFPSRPEAAVGALLLSLAAAGLFIWKKLPADSGPADVAVVESRAIRYSAWYAMIPITTYLFDFSDRWVIARYHGLELAGAYSFIPAVASAMNMIGLSYAPVALREASAIIATDRRAAMDRVWFGMKQTVVLVLICAAGVRVCEPLIWIVFGDKWSAAAVVMAPLLAYFCLYNVGYVLGSAASLLEKTWLHLVAGLLGAGLNLSLNLAWVPSLGIEGAAAATILGQAALVSVHLIFLRRMGIAMPGGAWIALLLPAIVLLPTVWMLAAMAALVPYAATGFFSAAEKRELARWIPARFRP